MSQPVPDAERRPSVFAVPEHIGGVLLGGGCGVMHVPQNGAVDCAACYPISLTFAYPAPAEIAGAEPAVAAAEEPIVIAVLDSAPAKARKSQPAE